MHWGFWCEWSVPWHFLRGDEDVLTAGAVVVDVAAGDVVMD